MVVKFFKLDFSLYVPQLRAGLRLRGGINRPDHIDVRPAGPEETEPGEVTVKEKNYENITIEKKFTIADYDQREAVSKVRALLLQVAMTRLHALQVGVADAPVVPVRHAAHESGRRAAGQNSRFRGQGGEKARGLREAAEPLADALGVNPDAADDAVARKPSKKDD